MSNCYIFLYNLFECFYSHCKTLQLCSSWFLFASYEEGTSCFLSNVSMATKPNWTDSLREQQVKVPLHRHDVEVLNKGRTKETDGGAAAAAGGGGGAACHWERIIDQGQLYKLSYLKHVACSIKGQLLIWRGTFSTSGLHHIFTPLLPSNYIQLGACEAVMSSDCCHHMKSNCSTRLFPAAAEGCWQSAGLTVLMSLRTCVSQSYQMQVQLQMFHLLSFPGSLKASPGRETVDQSIVQ